MTKEPESHDQTALLQAIWSEVKTTHQSLGRRIDETRADLGRRIDETNERLDSTNARLDQHVVHIYRRFDLVDASLRELASQQLLLTRFVKTSLERHGGAIELLEARADHHDEVLGDLKDRVTRLEADRPHGTSP